MRKISIAVCDRDCEYGERLIEWVSMEREARFCGAYFSSRECFLSSQKKQEYDIVLLGEGFCNMQEIEGTEEGHTLWVGLWGENGEENQEMGQIPVVKKYQPAPEIIRQVFEYYHKEQEKKPVLLEQPIEVIGVYSPDGSCWQAPFSLILSQTLSGKRQVLYINLMECAGFGGWFQTEYQHDILDVMYLLDEKKGNVSAVLHRFLYSMEGFDYIPPAADGQLLGEVTEEDYGNCLKELAKHSGYDVLIVDFGSMVQGFFRLLRNCTRIYITCGYGSMSAGKKQQFQEMVRRQEDRELEERITYLDIPGQQLMQGGDLMQQWLWGTLGDYVRGMAGAAHGGD